MASTTIRDHVIWAKHVHGDARLVDRIVTMRPGELIRLVVDGVPGRWRKMDDGKDGRPTPGLRPVGDSHEHWQILYGTRRGDFVEIDVAEAVRGVAEDAKLYERPLIEKADPEKQEAAWQALKESWKQERYIPDDTIVITRDDMHDRELDRLK